MRNYMKNNKKEKIKELERGRKCEFYLIDWLFMCMCVCQASWSWFVWNVWCYYAGRVLGILNAGASSKGDWFLENMQGSSYNSNNLSISLRSCILSWILWSYFLECLKSLSYTSFPSQTDYSSSSMMFNEWCMQENFVVVLVDDR